MINIVLSCKVIFLYVISFFYFFFGMFEYNNRPFIQKSYIFYLSYRYYICITFWLFLFLYMCPFIRLRYLFVKCLHWWVYVFYVFFFFLDSLLVFYFEVLSFNTLRETTTVPILILLIY